MGRWGKYVERLRSNHAFLLLGLSVKSSHDASVFAGRGNEASDSSVRGGIPIAGVDREGVNVHVSCLGVFVWWD